MLWTMMTNDKINIKAEEVLAQHVKIGGVFKVFDKIMHTENIKFREVNSSNSHFVGALTNGLNGQTYIMVNKNIHNMGRRNFTIAHELGHYYLSHQLRNNAFYCVDSDINEDGVNQNSIEQEANYFASCLLMPEKKIISAFLSIVHNSIKGKDIDFLHVNRKTYKIWLGICDEFKKRYGVSEAALRYRLIQLNLVKFEFDSTH